jgi:hypothetical protein
MSSRAVHSGRLPALWIGLLGGGIEVSVAATAE